MVRTNFKKLTCFIIHEIEKMHSVFGNADDDFL